MAIKREFRETGYLQELNRCFLHPLGLAIEAVIDESGNETLGGVQDYRDDADGIIFSDDSINSDKFKEKALRVDNEYKVRSIKRMKQYSYIIQPLPDSKTK